MSDKLKYDVILTACVNRVEIMQAIMSITSLGLRGSKDITDNVPSPVMTGVKYQFALKSKDILEKAGGSVEIRPTEND
jgi:large subunit ribosomal protein L7/L12